MWNVTLRHRFKYVSSVGISEKDCRKLPRLSISWLFFGVRLCWFLLQAFSLKYCSVLLNRKRVKFQRTRWMPLRHSLLSSLHRRVKYRNRKLEHGWTEGALARFRFMDSKARISLSRNVPGNTPARGVQLICIDNWYPYRRKSRSRRHYLSFISRVPRESERNRNTDEE